MAKLEAFSSEKEARKARANVFAIAAEFRKRIRKHYDNHKVHKTGKAAREFLRSHKVRTAYVLKVAPNLDLEEAKEIANRVDPYRSEWPPISWYKHPKRKPGAYRPVCKFTIAHQATLKMIAAVLAAQWNRPKNLYGTASSAKEDDSNGRDAAARRVQKYLEDGFTYVATADIKNAFGSIDPDKLYENLPLDKKIIANILDLRNQRFKEVDPPDCVSSQKQHVGVTDTGADHVWLEYTVGLRKSSTLSNSPNSDKGYSAGTEAYNHAPLEREDAILRPQEQGTYHSPILGTSIDKITSTHSELVPSGLAQGSAASPIIFAMLLGELPNATDDARFLIVHDDIVILARTPEARSRLAKTLTDYCASQSRAGSLTVEIKTVTDSSKFEWLGYVFDPASVTKPGKGIGVADHSYFKLLKRLNLAEAEDLADLENYGNNRASNEFCVFPLRIWHTLRQWRAGQGAVHPEHEDLTSLLDGYMGSQWVAARYAIAFNNPQILELHKAIFATRDNPGASTQHALEQLRATLKRFPLGG